MKLLALLRKEAAVSLRYLVVLAALSGISSALVLAIINASAGVTSTAKAGSEASGSVIDTSASSASDDDPV